MLEGVPARVTDLVRATREFIRNADVGNTPQLDAELLVGHVSGLDRVGLRTRSDDVLTPKQFVALDALVGRRIAGEPIAYLLGTAWFYGREFEVDRRVLVPRPETELLVDIALERLAETGGAARVIDACTGSGCVAISVAAEAASRWPDRSIEVSGTDISADALEVAAANAVRHASNVQVLIADLLEGVGEPGTVSVITANPPYVEGADAAGLEVGVRDHEPHVALFVPDEGVEAFYARLAEQAIALLEPGGVLAVEHGLGQRALVTAAFERAGFADVAGRDDLAGIDRVVVGRRVGT